MPSSSSFPKKPASFPFVIEARSKEALILRASVAGWASSSPSKMKLMLNNWVAKVLSLVLAVILWSVIHKSQETTTSPSRFQFELEQRVRAQDKFQFDASRYGNPAKK